MINHNVTDFSKAINTTPRLQPSIYIACLASHLNGETHGKWIKANQSVEALKEAAQGMLATSPAGEKALHWTILKTKGFGPLVIDAFTPLTLISRLAAFLIQYGEWGAILISDFDDDLNLANLEKVEYWMAHDDHRIKKPGSKRSDQLIARALFCLETRFHRELNQPNPLRGSSAIKNYLRLQLAEEKNEVFAILFLDVKSRLLSFDKLFRGTIDHVQIHHRVILQKVLDYNASTVILAHNHPSGICIPTPADQQKTEEIKQVLNLIDVCVLDHIIVSGSETYSFADYGIL